MTDSLSKDLLAGADAAAAYTGLTRRVIYHLVESGVLPVKRIGRRLYFRRSELDTVFGSSAADSRGKAKSSQRGGVSVDLGA